MVCTGPREASIAFERCAGSTTCTCAPSAASAGGSAPRTSPSPPVATNGDISDAAIRMRGVGVIASGEFLRGWPPGPGSRRRRCRGPLAGSSACSRASAMVSTNSKCISWRAASGMSSRSFSLRRGRIDGADAGAFGRQDLFLDAADRQHLAAQRDLAGHGQVVLHRPARSSSEASAVAMVMPADGPSLGTAPAGTWMWRSRVLEEIRGDAQALGARADVAERGLRRLLHDVAQLAGERQALLAGHLRRLDEEDVAAVRRPGEAGRDAGLVAALGDLGEEALGARGTRGPSPV